MSACIFPATIILHSNKLYHWACARKESSCYNDNGGCKNQTRATFYSRFQLCESDQHPCIAFIMTVLPQWHAGEHSGVKIYEPGEVVLIQLRIPFLLQVRQIGEARFGRVWTNDLVDVVCVIWKEDHKDHKQKGTKLNCSRRSSKHIHYLRWDTFLVCWAFDKAWRAAVFCLCALLLPSEKEKPTSRF